MSESLEAVREILKKYDQEHLLLKYDEMTEESKKYLLEQIEDIDFDQMKKLYESTKSEHDVGSDKIEPISYVNQFKLSQEERDGYKKVGEETIRAGKLGFITMAGGQRNKAWAQRTKRYI